MKKFTMLLIVIAMIFIAAGCGDNNSSKQPDNDKKESTTETDKKRSIETSKSSENGKKQKEEQAQAIKPEYKLNEKNWSIEPIGDAPSKVVLVTIDDAPDKHAVEMAIKLKKMNVPAIFFVNGHFIDSEKGKNDLKKIHDMGFVIGNHTYSHNSLPEQSNARQKKEITDVDQMVEDAIGKRPSFFRAPFGQNTDNSKKVAADEDLTLMNWTYGYDWNNEYMTKDTIQKIMVNAPELNDGANLLMHDREWTNDALEGIIKGLRDKGYGFVDPKKIKGYHP
ncbi:polysaccharide deacetylase family protein [Aciduricibacillus chroicocephali]|uniref:Polysaccharide deacetylase family protein n=1 Tax=Aciduricibacillus chroicocephali TaxID=3054939 RepID=A0ABY9KXV1_9BACI|nr:polysaccharide deacetylase family protein [Bacillaceae bacterium 44XB]